MVEELATAQLMEQEILLGVGLTAPCGCSKFVICPFPTTTWYYVTICLHDNDAAPRATTPNIIRAYWWYDINKQRMISAVDFEKKCRVVLAQQSRGWNDDAGMVCGVNFFDVRLGSNVFSINTAGQVRRVYPKPGDWR